jgi:hypothetical protein
LLLYGQADGPNIESLNEVTERQECDCGARENHRISTESISSLRASKARFFGAFGFRAREWQIFADAVREHGQTHDVVRVRETGFGLRYEVEGALRTPDGGYPRVRTVWQMDQGAVAPRLITAYPTEKTYD